jgi:predicted kinase
LFGKEIVIDQNTAFLMVGAPGSGKSTLATKIAEAIGAKVIGADDCRAELYGDANNQGEWSEVENLLEEKLVDSLGFPIVWDNTHCDLRSRRKQTALLRSYGYKVVAVLVDKPLDTCLLQNGQRQRNVPEHVIRRMHEKLQKNKDLMQEEDFEQVVRLSTPFRFELIQYNSINDKEVE